MPKEIDRHQKGLSRVAAGLDGEAFTLANCCHVLQRHFQRDEKLSPQEAVASDSDKDATDTLKFVFRELDLDMSIPTLLGLGLPI